MRLREAHIPIFLWVSAAALLHLGGGEQADRLASLHENTTKLRVAARSVASPPVLTSVAVTPGNLQLTRGERKFLHVYAVFSDGVRQEVTASCKWSTNDDKVVTVGEGRLWYLPGLSVASGDWPGLVVAHDPGLATVSCNYEGFTATAGVQVDIALPEIEVELPDVDKTPELAKKDDKKPEPKKDEPKVEKKKEEIAAVMPPPEDLPKPPVPAEPPPPPPPEDEKKISVQQHQDKDEEPNPEAHYLADKNHKVKPGEETQASITSLHENDKNPTPGTHHGAPDSKPGNADKTVVAQDENRPGEKVAPNVVPKGLAVKQPVEKQPDPPKNPGTEKGNDKPASPNAPKTAPTAVAVQPKPEGKGISAPPTAPPATTAEGGKDPVVAVGPQQTVPTAPSTAPPGAGNGKPKTLPTLPTPGGPKWVAGLGFGAKGTAGKPSISIDEKIAKAAIGMDQLDKLKKVEGETKLSQHKGAWKSSSLERWRAAIENYVPGVKAGNQTNLGTAAAPWATYLAQIHVRLHPIFAEGFVEGLGDLPAGHPLNDKSLVTRMEIVMKPDGTIDHLGIVKPSGVTAFDIAALDAVDRAAPFGKAPDAIVSPDGLVYLHWEFHRDEMRCSNVNAYPYVLKEGQTPKAPAPKEPPAPKPAPEGKPAPGQMGALKSPNG